MNVKQWEMNVRKQWTNEYILLKKNRLIMIESDCQWWKQWLTNEYILLKKNRLIMIESDCQWWKQWFWWWNSNFKKRCTYTSCVNLCDKSWKQEMLDDCKLSKWCMRLMLCACDFIWQCLCHVPVIWYDNTVRELCTNFLFDLVWQKIETRYTCWLLCCVVLMPLPVIWYDNAEKSVYFEYAFSGRIVGWYFGCI